MQSFVRLAVLALAAAAVLALPLSAAASPVRDAVSTFEYTKNMKPMGFSERFVMDDPTLNNVNSDIAFRGKYAFQGHFNGFRIIDISAPANPVEITNYHNTCLPGQGDVIVYQHLLVRSADGNANPAEGGACGFVEGVRNVTGLFIFDISDLLNPVPVASVSFANGSHTATGVPDPENNRLVVYSSPSNSAGIDIVEIPLDDPAGLTNHGRHPSGTPFAGALVNFVDVHDGGAAGTYPASGSNWHPDPTAAGVTGPMVLVSAAANPAFPGALPSEGCGPLVGFPAGSIALVDRGTCPFLEKVMNAQMAGAIGVIVLNNTGGNPTTMGGDSHEITIPSAMVSQAVGNSIKANLPATGTIRRHPDAVSISRACHDTGVILGDVMKAACAGGNGVSVWSLHPDDGGSLIQPALQWSRSLGVGIGHSAAFSWDGEVLIFGHEPGGGTQAQCQATSSLLNRTLFFLDPEDGHIMGTFIHPRPQGANENCTWHNYNVVPTDKRHILVSGNYQSGISVVDFTDHENIHEIAYADPAPLLHPSGNPNQIFAGGDWSTHWYNGFIYQSDIRRGLIVWNLSDNRVAGARKFPYLNPQTQETSFPFKGTAHGTTKRMPGNGHGMEGLDEH
jgi:hypothetical protein